MVGPKALKVDKKADDARSRVSFGNEEEDADKGPGGPGGPGGPAGSKASQRAAQAEQEEQQQAQVKRKKRVKVSEFTAKKTGSSNKAQNAQGGQEAARAGGATPQELGRKLAMTRLHEQSRLNQTRLQFESARRQESDPNSTLTPQGRQRGMLNNLIAYQNNNLSQHSGDKCGELYNRPATRQILQALQGLKQGMCSDTKKESSTDRSAGLSPGAFKAKSKNADDMLKMFMLADMPQHDAYEHVA